MGLRFGKYRAHCLVPVMGKAIHTVWKVIGSCALDVGNSQWSYYDCPGHHHQYFSLVAAGAIQVFWFRS